MAIILKPLFEILTGDIAICDNILLNYIFLLAIGKIAYHLAYESVGKLYSSGVISGHTTGSIAHWIIRLPIYIASAYLLHALIWIYNFIVSVPVQIWLTLFALLIVGFIYCIIFRISHRNTV